MISIDLLQRLRISRGLTIAMSQFICSFVDSKIPRRQSPEAAFQSAEVLRFECIAKSNKTYRYHQ